MSWIDVSQLTLKERIEFYQERCESLSPPRTIQQAAMLKTYRLLLEIAMEAGSALDYAQ